MKHVGKTYCDVFNVGCGSELFCPPNKKTWSGIDSTRLIVQNENQFASLLFDPAGHYCPEN